ncbi:MAG: hypothetical protein ABI142_10760, partial [Bryocella sp.]
LVEPDTEEGATRLLRAWGALGADERSAMSQQALVTFEARYDMRKNAAAILRVFDDSDTTGASRLVEGR